MEKEENQHDNSDNQEEIRDNKNTEDTSKTDENLNPEEKIKELEDRLARAYAEIEKRDTK